MPIIKRNHWIIRWTGLSVIGLLSHHLVLAADAQAANSKFTFKHGQVSLVTDTDSIKANQDFKVGVHFTLEKGWHIYYKNPGDVGLPTEALLTLPGGLSAGELEYPAPKKIVLDDMTSLGYEDTALLVSQIKSSANLKLNSKSAISAKVSWALCNDECIPGSADLILQISSGKILGSKSIVRPQLFKVSAAPVEAPAPSSIPISLATLFATIASAFIGGIILNLMPCVFPVLAIKVMSFANHSGSSKAKAHGLVFGAGVLVSFWLLAGLLILLRSGGSQLGWGFQFQSPVFVAALILVLFAFGLSLMGVFEFGHSLQTWAGRHGNSQDYSGSFTSGVLATLLSTPCSAPFMGSAVAMALSFSPFAAMAVFTSLGLGVACPYVLLSFFPRLMKFVPRPGNWMVTFKQAMSFPIFATCLWLLWVEGQQTGQSGMLMVLLGLLMLSIGAWILGNWGAMHRSLRCRRIGLVTALIMALASGYVALPISTPAVANASYRSDSNGISWDKFSDAKLTELLNAHRPVIVDFTASWCLTCQMNHKMAYDNAQVISKIKEKGIITLRADWTNQDAEIAKTIQKYGRNSVPLDVFFAPNDPTPVVLPSVLTAQAVLDKINALE
jgi:thiol:disulfide interchange protein